MLVDALSDIIVIISKEMTGHHDHIIIIVIKSVHHYMRFSKVLIKVP